MKKTLIFLLLLAVLFLSGCSGDVPVKPDTDLEFWIAENVDNVDFSGYTEKYGIMGGREYYGKGYSPSTNENGEQIDPAECVIYTVTSYPDYSSGKKHITRITVTDPSVEVYGLTLLSPIGEIGAVMEKEGFKADGTSYTKGKVTIRFTGDSIIISVDVSNILGIQF